MSEIEILEKIKASYQTILKEKLVGIYIHGSIAFQCFNWGKSDIDFLVVVKEALSQEEKEALILQLLILDEKCPPKGLEMSVVLEHVCNPFVYPTPFELHFSNGHKEKCKEDLTEYCKNMKGLDKDLAAHFTVVNKVGIALYGKEISEVFEAVPKNCYVDSIFYDIENAKEEIEENSVYFILNMCRVLAYLKSDLVLSKKQGGEWGIENLPDTYRTLIEHALEVYQTNIEFEKDEILHSFVEYMLKYIKEEMMLVYQK